MLSTGNKKPHPSSVPLIERQQEAEQQRKLQEQQQKFTALKVGISETEKLHGELASVKQHIQETALKNYINPLMNADHITLTIKRMFAVYFALWCETKKYSLSTLLEQISLFAALLKGDLRNPKRSLSIIQDVSTPLGKILHHRHPRYSNDDIEVVCPTQPIMIIEPNNIQLRKLILIKECEDAIWKFLAYAARKDLANADDLAKKLLSNLMTIEFSSVMSSCEISARIKTVIESYQRNKSYQDNPDLQCLSQALTIAVEKFTAATLTKHGADNSPKILSEKISLWIQNQGVFKELANKPPLSLKATLALNRNSRFDGHNIPPEIIAMTESNAEIEVEIETALRAFLTSSLKTNINLIDHLIQHLPQYAALSLVSKLTELRSESGFLLNDVSKTISVTKNYSGNLAITIEIFIESQEPGSTPQVGIMSVSFLLNFHSSNIHYAEPTIRFFGPAKNHCHRVFLQTMLRDPTIPLNDYVKQNLGPSAARAIPTTPKTPGKKQDVMFAALSPLSPDNAPPPAQKAVLLEPAAANKAYPRWYDVHRYLRSKIERQTQGRRRRNPNSGGSHLPSPVVSDSEE